MNLEVTVVLQRPTRELVPLPKKHWWSRRRHTWLRGWDDVASAPATLTRTEGKGLSGSWSNTGPVEFPVVNWPVVTRVLLTDKTGTEMFWCDVDIKVPEGEALRLTPGSVGFPLT